MDESEKDWKLKLRYGKIQTPYKHYSVIADCVVGQLADGFSCVPGNAWVGMKTWASSPEESADIILSIGEQIGFSVIGDIKIYDTEPDQPPQEYPHGYDITFNPYDKE